MQNFGIDISSLYLYDASGERVWKLTGPELQMQINAQTVYTNLTTEKTLYASPLMVMTEGDYTKHYYIEGERVCSKLGGGFGPAPQQPTGPHLTCIEGDLPYLRDHLKFIVRNFLDCTYYEGQWNIEPVLQPAHNTHDDPETKRFFYHSDHLGSSSFITNIDGRADQHIQYLPFGELFINQSNNHDFDSRYKFTAKELDNETNYTYFGARYYDSDASIWLSVDPLSDKYPSLSPYAYCANNPIRYIDPDGRKIVPTNSEGETAIRSYVDNFNPDVQKNVFKIHYSGPDGGKNNYSEYPEYSSMSVKGWDQYSDFKSFKIAMKSNGAKLNKQEMKEAHGFYLALISKDTYTVDGVVSGTSAKTFEPGTESSKVVDNVTGYRKREVYNENLNNALINYQNDPNQNIDILLNPENADKSGTGFVFYENQINNSTTKGSVFIDTRNSNWQNNLGNAFKTVFDIE